MITEQQFPLIASPNYFESHAFPIMHAPDYFDIRKIYRMENSEGRGPFLNFAARELKLHKHFKTHLLPQYGIKLNRQVYPDHELFSRKNYYKMLKAGRFGWRTRELYDQFFIGDGEYHCNQAGFFLVEYEPVEYIPFPDGQVLFLIKDK